MRIMTLIASCFLALSCCAQTFFIDLHGLVTDYSSATPLKDVLVHVASTDQTSDLLTKKDGAYSVQLKKGVDYHISFIKKGMVTKMVRIDTRAVPEYPDVPFYDMDLQVTLFPYIEEVDFSFFDEPIALAEYRHSVRSVNWDNDYTETHGRKMSAFMREYRKKAAGYYARSVQKPKILLLDSTLVLADDSTDQQVVQKAMDDFIPQVASSYYDQQAAPATQVETVKGLFFTVQVGVYSKPVSLDRIYNITPLNSELMDDGRIRYTSGMFDSMDEAGEHRKKVIALGVKDAFIVAYFNGKRIPLDDAVYLSGKFGNRLGRQ